MTQKPRARRVAGCDLGKANARFVIGHVAGDGQVQIEQSWQFEHRGKPFEVFARWYQEQRAHELSALGVTGLYGSELRAPVWAGLPEDACVEAGVGEAGPLNIVRVGARGTSLWTRDAGGEVSFFENERCSSGTGENMLKIAARFGLDLAEADRLAAQAAQSIAISARCSVFAKSEMTHFANQGRPRDQLLRGYFESVARLAAGLLDRARVDGPVWLVGGCARVETFVRAFTEQVAGEVRVPELAQDLEARGAMQLAAQLSAEAQPQTPRALPLNPAELRHPREPRFTSLPPVTAWADRVQRLPDHDAPDAALRQPSVLGIDLGSTGAKLALSALDGGELLLDIYDRTRGNPVEAMQRLVRQLLDRVQPDVRAIGLTGSGREAAATVLRAVFAAQPERVLVRNEILAHATAAIRCDPDAGRSLSVVEIGGQDAKFIQIEGGRVIESDMNKACSAGTGSFLEEQAALYGVKDIRDFTRLSAQATRPPDLGQMCTVFVADAAGEAQGEGFAIADLFAGFERSVIVNYLNRVRGQRRFGERIFFQGKPASSPTLARTLAAIAERDVVVPARPGAMGAWGVGLCVLDELHAPQSVRGALDLRAILDATITARDTFRCQDKSCATSCVIERSTVQIGGERRRVLSGGACPKFEERAEQGHKLPRDAPQAFARRAALLAGLEAEGPRPVGLPQVTALQAVLPLLATFVRELGFGLRLLRPDRGALKRGEVACFAYDACAPAKVAHGVIDAEIDAGIERVLFPKILDLVDRDGACGATCPMEQALPDMVQQALRARGRRVEVLRPPLSVERKVTDMQFVGQMFELAQQLGASKLKVPAALRAALAAQERYEEALADIGDRCLAYAREHALPAVVLAGSLHVLHDPALNAGVDRILRDNGAVAIPMDCYRIPKITHATDRVVWADSRRAIRVALDARARGDVFPLLLSSFGCGPASMTEPIFTALMEGYPHGTLEMDGHGGQAGYVTRVQAFLHTVRRHAGGASPVTGERLQVLQRREPPSIESERGSRILTFAISDGFSKLLAAFLRSMGYQAEATGPSSRETLAAGRQDCSGKECLPYQLIWGAYRQKLDEDPADPRRTVLLEVTEAGTCKNCMFAVKDQLNLQRLGLADRVDVRLMRAEPEFGALYGTKLFAGLVAWDLIFQLASWYRPSDPERVDALYDRSLRQLVAHMEIPEVGGLGAVPHRSRWWSGLTGILSTASEQFEAIGSGGRDLPAVLVTGDVFMRLDAFAGDDIIRKLNRRGLRVLVEPSYAFLEYLSMPQPAGVNAMPTSRLATAPARALMGSIRRRLYDLVGTRHPQIPQTDIEQSVAAAESLLQTYPAGEAPMTVGCVLHAWDEAHCQGAVIIGPWGCAPTQIAESVLRQRRDIPLLVLYSDGGPLDERRIDAFAFRLRHHQALRPAG